MKFSRIKFLTALAVMACLSVAAQSRTMTPREQKNLKFVLDWWREVIVARHVELAEKYQAEDYIQHNPNVPTGRAAFIKFFGTRPPVNPIPDKLPSPPAVAYAKGDHVVLVWDHEDKDPADPSKTYHYNSFDVLRTQNGKIQEHWDSAMKNPPQPQVKQ